MLRQAAIAIILTAAMAAPVTASAARGQGGPGPEITVFPTQGTLGTIISVTGDGFAAGDTVFVEMFPTSPRNGGTIRLATVNADDTGAFEFETEVGRHYPGPGPRADEPPGGGKPIFLIPRDYFVMAYAESFGGRTLETIEKAPKEIFTVTQPGALPSSGGPPWVSGRNGFPWDIAASGIGLVSLGAAVVAFRRGHAAG